MAGWAMTGGEATVYVLGVRFDCLPRRQVVERLLYWIDEGSRRMVITAGPEFVMMAQTDEELRHIARVADLVTPDGVGVVWAARRQGHGVPERVTGVELGMDLLATAEERKRPLRVYLLGAQEPVLQLCVTRLQRQFPHLKFAGHHGYFQPDELPGILAEVAAFAPHVWLVGLGQPRQEKLIYGSLAHLPPCVAIGVGGSMDVWSGTVKRAPRLFQAVGAEWLYRLIRQPSR
ncbi:MAG: WecB/TagA/CpsF family glycosyltransferase, partial [Alicyclobacillus sp.]|nr:WecB/TagA/CpsF family glycosyltransferase [Alicyclobacillus sp.]